MSANLPLLAALQMVSGSSQQHNLERAAALIAEAAAKGAKLAVLPESFSLFCADVGSCAVDEAFGEAPVRGFLREQAKRHRIWLVAGTLPLAPDPDSKRNYAASFIVDDEGRERARYDKIHLFDADVADNQGCYRESDSFIAGDQALVIDTPVGRLGVAVCYDIRFPELFRLMQSQRVDVVAVPSAFTLATGEPHWLPLLKARAIENQCYIVGANQGGNNSKSRQTSGGSVIIDGWGRVLAEAGRGEACMLAEMDAMALQRQRSQMPVLQHRRFHIVGESAI